MSVKNIVSAVLLAFVAASAIYLVMGRSKTATESTFSQWNQPPQASDEVLPHQVVAYYFHRTMRCNTCRSIEETAKNTLVQHFGEELRSGELQWQLVNLDEPENEHFVDEFDLAAATLVLEERVEGHQTRWKNLEEVWTLVGDADQLSEYVREHAEQLLREG